MALFTLACSILNYILFPERGRAELNVGVVFDSLVFDVQVTKVMQSCFAGKIKSFLSLADLEKVITLLSLPDLIIVMH